MIILIFLSLTEWLVFFLVFIFFSVLILCIVRIVDKDQKRLNSEVWGANMTALLSTTQYNITAKKEKSIWSHSGILYI